MLEVKREATKSTAVDDVLQQVCKQREQLLTELCSTERQVELMLALKESYPDARLASIGTEESIVTSASVNPSCDQIRFDAPYGGSFSLFAYPFTVDAEGHKVHSSPHRFLVGVAHTDHTPGMFGCGYNSEPHWEESMREAGLPQSIIDQVYARLAEDPPQSHPIPDAELG